MKAIKATIKRTVSTSRGRIIALSIILFLAATITGGLIYWNLHKRAFVRDKLEAALARKTKGLYKVQYDSLDFDEIDGWLTVSNVQLNYDSSLYEKAVREGNAPPVLLTIQIPKIRVSGIKTPRALLNNEIVGSKVELTNPMIRIEYTYQGKDSASNIPTKEVYEQILGNLDLIQLDTVLISGAQLVTSRHSIQRPVVQMSNMTILLKDVKVDSTANSDTSRLLFARSLDLTCGAVAWPSANKLYNYSLQDVGVNSATQTITIRHFQILPTLGEEAFTKALALQDDRFDFSMDEIAIKGINMFKLMDEKLLASEVQVNKSSFKIYRDLGKQRDKKNRVGHYPQQAIMHIPFIFAINKINLVNTFVEYKERNAVTRRAGKVQFYNVAANFSNFTNDEDTIAVHNVMEADINASFLDKAPLKTVWTFYLLNPKGRFDLRGSLGAINAVDVNPLTEPMGPASMKDGHISNLTFDLKGHDYGMGGTVKLLYENLKVAILKKEKNVTADDQQMLPSLLANMIIKNDNPGKNGDVRVTQVSFDRDTNRSIFHLCWKTLFKGIKETVGIKK